MALAALPVLGSADGDAEAVPPPPPPPAPPPPPPPPPATSEPLPIGNPFDEEDVGDLGGFEAD